MYENKNILVMVCLDVHKPEELTCLSSLLPFLFFSFFSFFIYLFIPFKYIYNVSKQKHHEKGKREHRRNWVLIMVGFDAHEPVKLWRYPIFIHLSKFPSSLVNLHTSKNVFLSFFFLYISFFTHFLLAIKKKVPFFVSFFFFFEF